MKKSDKNKILKIVREDLRDEVTIILEHASPYRINELLNYHKQDKDNIVCMHLSLIKKELVFYKILEQKDTDEFGSENYF